MHGYRNKNTLRPIFRVLLGIAVLFFLYGVVKALLTTQWVLREQFVDVIVLSLVMVFVGYLCLFGRVPRRVIKICIRVNKAERKVWKKLKKAIAK